MTAPRKTATPRKRVPATAPKPQDHKPKQSPAARKAEAEGFVLVELRGLELKIPVGDSIPLDVILLYGGDEDTLREHDITDDMPERERRSKLNVVATKLVLGPEQWAEFRKTSPTLRDFNEIGLKVQEATGN
ncbi:adenylosuccinate synthase [Tsukamurella ocularis]